MPFCKVSARLELELVTNLSEEQGKKLQCEDCMACDGGISKKGSPVIVVHGSLASRFIN